MDELIIQIIAALEKHLSRKQIKKDIKDLEKTPFYIKLIGRLNKSLTRGQIQADIRNIQNTANNNPIELNAEINSDSLQRSFDEARADLERNIQNNPVDINVNANVDTDEIVQAQQQIGRHTNRILGDYITANQIFRAVIQSIKVAVQEIENLNKAETDLRMITQNSAEEIKSLMQDYNNLAVEMGATTLQVTSGASEWLRQGKSISDTNELIRDSMILSKISQMESSEATKHLTSAMNGFKLETSEVIGVVDKLNAVDLASASDAAGLAESLSRCANSADIAGISVDRLIAYIATVSEITQKSASSVGEGFKSITARLQNIKANKFIDEDGIDISGEINDAEKILGKFNIALRDNAKEFRNAEDVIDDVAKSWHNMSSVEQSAIASAFGTVHQRENVIALFENYNRVLELTEVSANSAGTAMEKFAVYENSLEASTNRLVASLQGIAYNTIDSNFLTNLANGTAQIVEFIDKTKLLKTGLTAGIFTGALTGLTALGTRMVAVRNNVAQFTQAMNISRQSTALSAGQYDLLRNNVQGLTEAQLRLVLSSNQLNEQQRRELMQAAGIEQARQQQLLQTWNLTDAANAQTTATFSLRGAWESLKASIISNPIGLIVAGLTTAVTVISNVKQKQEELRQSISDSAQAAKEQTDKLNDLIKSYEEFADKVTYTAEEKEKLKEIQGQLVESYHTEVDGIDLVNGKYDEQIEKLRQLKKEKLEDAELSLIAQREQAHRDSSYGNLSNKSFNISADWFNSTDDYNKIVDELEKRVKGFTTDIAWASKAVGIDSQINLFAGNADYRIEQLKEAMAILKENGYANIGLYAELNKLLSKYQELSDTENTAISDLAENKFQQYQIDNPYDEKAGKDAYLSWKRGLIESANGDNELQQELTALAEKQFPDYQEYFHNLAKARSMFRGYANSAKEGKYETDKDNFLLGLSDEDLKIAVQIPDLFKDGLDGASKVIEDFKNNPDNQISVDVETSEADTSSLDKLQEAYDDLSKSAESYTKSQKALTDALDEQKEHGQLSANTIQSLVDAGYAQALVTDKVTGAVTLSIKEYERLNEQKRQAIILEAEQQKTELEQKFKDEQRAIYDLVAEYEHANEERRKAIILEKEQHGLAMADISAQMAQIDALAHSTTAPTFENSSGGSTKDDKPKSIIDFETELARRQHEIKMGRMEEDEAYFDWLEKAYREAYKGLTGYQDDIYKYEEMVYDGRQKLAEDFYNEQQKAFEKRVDDLEARITIATDDNTDYQGNNLKPSEKFDYIRDVYDDILTEIDNRINEIVQSGVEGHEDELEQLHKQYEEYSDKQADVFKDEIDYEIKYIETLQDKYNDFIDSRIDRYEDEKKALEDRYDTEIKSIDDTIDALKDKNDATSKAIELKKAEQDLENAKQRTRMVYGADGTVSYRQDTDKVEEAQQKVDDLKLDMLLDSLEKQKEAKETEKDAALSKYDTMIADLEAQKKSQDEFFEKTLDKLNNENNPQPTESIDRVIDKTYDNPSEANDVKQGLKNVENAVNNGTEQAKDNANEVKKADNNTANSANKTDNKSQSANSKTATTSNSNNAVKTDVKQSGNSVNKNTSETADKQPDASNKQVVVYGEQVAVYDNGGESKQTEQTSNMDSFMKLVYSMSGKEPDGYERWKRGEYDEGNKLMSNIFSDDAFMGRAMKPFEDAMNSFNETVNKMNAVNATGQQSANITIGDININNPVGDTKQLAEAIKNELHKEAMMEIPNAAMKTIHSNLK